jgi:hypothetical protein
LNRSVHQLPDYVLWLVAVQLGEYAGDVPMNLDPARGRRVRRERAKGVRLPFVAPSAFPCIRCGLLLDAHLLGLLRGCLLIASPEEILDFFPLAFQPPFLQIRFRDDQIVYGVLYLWRAGIGFRMIRSRPNWWCCKRLGKPELALPDCLTKNATMPASVDVGTKFLGTSSADTRALVLR